MKIAIGSHYSRLDHRNSKIIVDGDTLSLNEEGVAYYKRLVTGNGEQSMELNCEIYNPLTGEVVVGEGSYFYEVK
ncbi:MAG: hypothetical protein KTR30_09630 [Saprospiraceae bacterium]|nr:hypothetical protein [Saprospiraceae bacterium]